MPKLMLSCGLLLTITMGIGYLAVHQASQSDDRLSRLYDQDLAALEAVKNAEVDKALIARCSRNAIIDADNEAAAEASNKEFQLLLSSLKADLALAVNRAGQDELKETLRVAQSLIPQYERGARAVFICALAHDSKNAKAALKANAPLTSRLNEAVRQAASTMKAEMQRSKAESRAAFIASRRQLVILIITAIGIGLGLSFLIARSFSNPLKNIVAILREVAAGDLTRNLAVNGQNEIAEIGTALNQAIDNIRQVLIEVGNSSSNLAGSSSQLARAADAIAAGAHKQAASLQETAASLEQITATVKQTADNAQRANELASFAHTAAEKGGSVVSRTVNAMDEINLACAKIESIIAAVDEIAFQTNLLSVNAAIEAAHASEHGRGFAVVATEVRNLARRSAGAAKEIKTLIGDSVNKAGNGVELVNQSGETLHEIVGSVKRVNDIVSEIASASNEQSAGVEQVNLAMMQMDAVTQANSSQTEELSATAGNLARQASSLQEIVGKFKVAAAQIRP